VSGLGFAEFYQAVHSRPPFPWQERLASQAVNGNWPDAIAIPTGCGKTSVIDVAVYALAAQAGSQQRNAAMRIFFVVDRRLVVDDVHRHALTLAAAVNEGKCAWVRDQLLKLSGPEAHALKVAVMRGGMYRSDSWADTPNQPLVCVSTVDQVGSRLLFRGYGISDSRRPMHAGLVGNDALIIVDEAHLSRPFLETLSMVERYQSDAWREKAPAAGLRFVPMSATVDGAFGLEADDLECEALKPRIWARKLADLREGSNLAESASAEALRLRREGAGVVGVVLNTVGAARATFEQLGTVDKVLLTGRIRPYDADQLREQYLERMKADRSRDAAPLFVVATQTVEVGADLDFDALVTEVAPMDALRQRFGRLNRLGQESVSRGVILKGKRSKDWVYGGIADRTWEWLNERSSPIDFGITALREWPADLNTTKKEAPLLFPAHLDAWAQTNPKPSADPDVAPFLHGPDPVETDVQIVWRADLDEDDPATWQEILKVVPPLSTEALPVPIGAARRWLGGGSSAVADLEGVGSDETEATSARKREFLIWRGPKTEDLEMGNLGAIRAGDTLVVRSSEGGCDKFGWNPESKKAVLDIGDECAKVRAAQGGGKRRLRVHPQVLFPQPEDRDSQKKLLDLLERVAKDDDDAARQLKEWIAKDVPAEGWNRARNYGSGDALLVQWRLSTKAPTTTDVDETDEGDESCETVQVLLDEHMERVGKKAREFGEKCGLRSEVLAAVDEAAKLHDLGKWDVRFQLKLGNTGAKPWAKGDGGRHYDHEFPPGARHEFASVALAEKGVTWPEDCDRELALHLIGTHHGYGRPLPPVWSAGDYEIRGQIDGRELSVRDVYRVARIDSGWVDRYWRLTRKYGWWGLAYLEMFVRRADCVRSREEEEERK